MIETQLSNYTINIEQIAHIITFDLRFIKNTQKIFVCTFNSYPFENFFTIDKQNFFYALSLLRRTPSNSQFHYL